MMNLRFDSSAVQTTSRSHAKQQLEERIARLEGFKSDPASNTQSAETQALVFASGRAALDAVLRLLRPGDRLVLDEEVNPDTLEVALTLEDFGISIDLRDLSDPSRWRFRNTSLVWLESPSAPTQRIMNIGAVAGRAHESGALVVVDNSFATAATQRPLHLGADIVVYTSSGNLLGDRRIACGALAVQHPDLTERLATERKRLGNGIADNEARAALIGLSTLTVRLERQNSNAQELAKHLGRVPGVREVLYMGLETHRGHVIALRQMQHPDGKNLFGSCITLKLESAALAQQVLETVKIFESRVHLRGGTVSEMRASDDALLLNVGLEDVRDLWDDLNQALRGAAQNVTPVTEAAPQKPKGRPATKRPAPTPEPEQAPPPVAATPAAPQPSNDAPETSEPDEPTGGSGGKTFDPSVGDPTRGMTASELERYAKLRDWRNTEAQNHNVSTLVIASNGLLGAVARANPNTIRALHRVPGMNPDRISKHGVTILELLGVNFGNAPLANEPEPDIETPETTAQPTNETPKRRGRPKKNPDEPTSATTPAPKTEKTKAAPTSEKRKPGRPKKVLYEPDPEPEPTPVEALAPRKRGRPKKSEAEA